MPHSMSDAPKIPVPTLTRLATYYTLLSDAQFEGVGHINSTQIESLSGIPATQVRKDLSHFGEIGKPGVGYEVLKLKSLIGAILKVDRPHRAVIVGAGRLGQALAHYPGLRQYGFVIVGAFDSDASKFGSVLGEVLVEDVASLPKRLKSLRAQVVILTVPSEAAQSAADLAVKGGARWILNFTPQHLRVSEGCFVRDVSFTQQFAVVAYLTED